MNEILSGPALRTALGIFKEWRLTDRQVRDMIGGATPITMEAWADAARARKPLRLPPGVMQRLTLILQIRQHVPQDQQSEWLRAKNSALSGQSPLAVIAASPEGLELVRDLARSGPALRAVR